MDRLARPLLVLGLLALLALAGDARARTSEVAVAQAHAARDASAVAAYRAGDWSAARAEWTALLAAEPRAAGPERARLLGNLGNVAFREGRVLESVGWFTAALRHAPRDTGLWANLEHARRVAKLEPADRGDLRATLRRLLGAFTPAEARLLALGGLALLAAGLSFEALRGGRSGRRAALAGAALALALAAPWIHGAWTALDAPALIVAEARTAVRSEPRESAAVVAEGPAGAEVELVDALPGWAKVRLADATEGWIPEPAVFALAR
ncbi:MAG: SH3 domain-containing protein [Planctomycetes bacterium]|nr:SH3 domain-containing protein [Planctomycetota bacterium]